MHEFGKLSDCVINLRSVCTILQGVWLASLTHSLLVHGFHLYILHGRLLRHAWYISNNEQWFKDQVCNVVSDLTSLTTNRHFLNQLAKKLVNSLVFLTSNDGKGEGSERIFSLHYTYLHMQEGFPDLAPLPATDVAGEPS